MSLSWDVLDRWISKGDSGAVTALLLSASEADRLAFAPAVAARIRADQKKGKLLARRPADMYALLVIGCSPSADRAATLLCHGDMHRWTWIPTSRFLEIARGRRLTWTADLGARLAATIGADGLEACGWRLVSSLLAEGGAPPPVTEGVVRSWFAAALRRTGDLGAVPHLDLMLPAVFEIDAMGSDLAEAGPDFVDAVAGLVAGGRLERAPLLATTVERLVRGGRPARLRPFVMLHDRLAPTPAEIAAATAGYTRLISDGPPIVAGLAQRALRRADEAGLLPLETLLNASAAVLIRPEKTLVKAQLTWLGRVVRRDPDRAGEVATTIGRAFGHPALDVQEQALLLVDKHVSALNPTGKAELASASSALAAFLRPRAAELFDPPCGASPAPLPEAPGSAAPGSAAPGSAAPGSAAPGSAAPGSLAPGPAASGPAAPGSAAPGPVASGPAAMPAAIGSAGELGEEVVALVHAATAVRWERILDGLARLRGPDETAVLRAVLRQVLHRHQRFFGDRDQVRFSFLGEAIRAVIGHQPQPGVHRLLTSTLETCAGTDPAPEPLTMPDGMLTLRIAELAVRLRNGSLPGLLATPTHVTGAITPEALISRIAGAEASDPAWTPLPFDVEQALLRVSPTADPAILARASALTSPVGRRLAGWLRDGDLPQPVSSRYEQSTTDPGDKDAGRRVVANLRPADGSAARSRLVRQMFTLEQPSRPYYHHWYSHLDGEVLAMVLPHHREAAAAWLLPGLAWLAGSDGGDSTLLPILAEGSGPAGPAMTLAVAYGLGARRTVDRAAGVDAFLLLVTGPHATVLGAGPLTTALGAGPFTRALGTELGDLCGDGTLKLARVVAALKDAHAAGASAAVWEVLAAALPALLETAPRGLPDLLELATGVAVAVGARGPVDGLAAAATRKGGSRLIREAKRLHTVVAAPAGNTTRPGAGRSAAEVSHPASTVPAC